MAAMCDFYDLTAFELEAAAAAAMAVCAKAEAESSARTMMRRIVGRTKQMAHMDNFLPWLNYRGLFELMPEKVRTLKDDFKIAFEAEYKVVTDELDDFTGGIIDSSGKVHFSQEMKLEYHRFDFSDEERALSTSAMELIDELMYITSKEAVIEGWMVRLADQELLNHLPKHLCVKAFNLRRAVQDELRSTKERTKQVHVRIRMTSFRYQTGTSMYIYIHTITRPKVY